MKKLFESVREFFSAIRLLSPDVSPQAKDRIRRNSAEHFFAWVRKNWVAMLASLGLASVTYFLICANIGYTISLDLELPIRVICEDERIAVANVSPQRIWVRFRGTQRELQALEQTNPNIQLRPHENAIRDTVNLQTECTDIVKIRTFNIQPRTFIRVQSIAETKVSVTLEPCINKKFAILTPQTEGVPYMGRKIGEISLNPSYAIVRGASSQIEEMENILQLPPIDVSGRVSKFTQRMKIIQLDEGPAAPRITPQEVEVTVDFRAENLEREFTNMPVRVATMPINGSINTRGNYFISPENVTVKLTALVDSLKDMEESEIKLLADASNAGMTGITNVVPISAVLPPLLRIQKCEIIPPTVKLIYVPAPEKEAETITSQAADIFAPTVAVKAAEEISAAAEEVAPEKEAADESATSQAADFSAPPTVEVKAADKIE